MSKDPYIEKPWLKFYDEGVPVEIDFPEINISQFIDNAAKEFGSRTAIWFLDHKLSYKKFKDNADRLATLTTFSLASPDHRQRITFRT